MQHSSSGEWVWPECIPHIPYAFAILDEEFSSLLLRREAVRRDQGERGSAKMITFTSSSLLYLRRIQTLKPLTVGVKGPKRIHEILTLGTSATREDAAGKNITVKRSLLCYKKDFQETNKTSLRGKTCKRWAGMRSQLHWCMKMLFSINFWSIKRAKMNLNPALFCCLAYQAALNSVWVCFLAWDVSTSILPAVMPHVLLKRLWGS